jgi:hypothetical protein
VIRPPGASPGSLVLPCRPPVSPGRGRALGTGRPIMCGLLIKCAALIVMIHGIRALGRLAGPRWSGLALGLPSTTAIVMVFCGCEQGRTAATAMAEGSTLGLVAAVALPLGYAWAVRHGWRLPGAAAIAICGYVVVATGLGCLTTIEAVPRLGLAAMALVLAAHWVGRIPLDIPNQKHHLVPPSIVRTMVLRSAIPVLYVLLLGSVEHVAGPSWAGLVSTFPSMSFVVLLVTHLEVGPLEASRIARVLPAGNASTLAFLAAFRLTCLDTGVGWATIAGYLAAVAAILVIEGIARRPLLRPTHAEPSGRYGPPPHLSWRITARAIRHSARLRMDVEADARGVSRHGLRRRPYLRSGFSPLVETLAW